MNFATLPEDFFAFLYVAILSCFLFARRDCRYLIFMNNSLLS